MCLLQCLHDALSVVPTSAEPRPCINGMLLRHPSTAFRLNVYLQQVFASSRWGEMRAAWTGAHVEQHHGVVCFITVNVHVAWNSNVESWPARGAAGWSLRGIPIATAITRKHSREKTRLWRERSTNRSQLSGRRRNGSFDVFKAMRASPGFRNGLWHQWGNGSCSHPLLGFPTYATGSEVLPPSEEQNLT